MGTITGTLITSTVTLGSGVYTSPLTISSTGTVQVSSGDAIYGPNTQAWVVANYGTVVASSGYGVKLYRAGYISNASGALIAGIMGASTGNDANGAGTVVNSGTIVG